MTETQEEATKRIFESPCTFRLSLESNHANRRQIVTQLKEVIWHIECGNRSVIGGGMFRISMVCDNPGIEMETEENT